MRTFAWKLFLGAFAVAACEGRITSSEPQPSLDAQLRQSIGTWGVIPIGPMPARDPAMVELGRLLFFDRVLSGNRDVACATCHHPSAALADGRHFSVGTGGTGQGAARELGPGRVLGRRSAPTLLNSGLGMTYQFWDGRLNGSRAGGFRLEDVEEAAALPHGLPDILVAQAMLPVLNRQEMRGEKGDADVFGGANEIAGFDRGEEREIWEAIMERILAIPEYEARFDAAFGQKRAHRFEEAARAIAEFQMEAFTFTRSPFDRYLDRNDAALTVEQKRGGLLFFGKARCSNCHTGPFLGGQGFVNVGVPQIGPGGNTEPPLDLGRGELPNNEFYRFAFRVAPLRNVELTAPYTHNGAYPTLEAVVRHYNDVPDAMRTYDARHHAPAVAHLHHDDEATVSAIAATLNGILQVPLGLTEEEMSDLVAFLEALTDPEARNLGSLVPARVPSGIPVP